MIYMPIRPYCLSIPSEIIDTIDNVRGGVPRSKAVTSLLAYLSVNQDNLKSIIPKCISYEEYFQKHFSENQANSENNKSEDNHEVSSSN